MFDQGLRPYHCSPFTPRQLPASDAEQPTTARTVLSKKIKVVWTPSEDEELRRLVETNGAKDWSYIASQFERRCGKQCRQRWHNHLRDGVRKDSWTCEEELILVLCVEAYGHKWSAISRHLAGRTDNTIKNHWNCKMKKRRRVFEASVNELLKSPLENLNQNIQILIPRILERRSQHAPIDEVLNKFGTLLTEYLEFRDSVCARSNQ